MKLSPLSVILTLPSLQGFSSGETDFHFYQFLSNFLKYSSLNFLLFHLYNIFTVNLSGNSSLLKSFFSPVSNFSCLLTSAFSLPLNLSTNSFVFSRSSSFFYVSFSAINPFYHTKYLSTPLTFLLFSIFSTFYSSTPSILIGFPSSFFCSLLVPYTILFN